MPPTGAVARVFMTAAALVFTACAFPSEPQTIGGRMPREIWAGGVDMVVQTVEARVSPEEVRAAVQAQLDMETMCLPWPGAWLQETERRRQYHVRFDLMERDWGADVAAASRTRMQEFVDLGLLNESPEPDGGVRFSLTDIGARYLRGSPYSSQRPAFCMPSERRVVDITGTEFGEFACGTLRVRFTHVADEWPSWARTERARSRVASAWTPLGVAGEGSVSLSRQWFTQEPPDGRANGQMRSLCYDDDDREVRGEDMELSAAPAPIN